MVLLKIFEISLFFLFRPNGTGKCVCRLFWIWVTQWFWVKMFALSRNIQEIKLSYVLGRPWNRASRSVLRSLMLAGILIFWDFFQRCLAYSVGSKCQPFIYVCWWNNKHLTTTPKGNSQLCFPPISMLP